MSIVLNVDNTRISVKRCIFLKHPDTMLGRMFSSSFDTLTHPNENGEYEVAEGISAIVFKAILGYYETGVIYCPPKVTVSELRHACDYFMIPFNAYTIRSSNMEELLQVISDETARKPFEKFFQEKILPSVDTAAKRGERVCRLFVLEEDGEDWVPIYGQPRYEISFHFGNKTIFTLLRKNKENRDVLTKVLQERGFQAPFLQLQQGKEYRPEHYTKSTTCFCKVINHYYVELSWEKKVQHQKIV